MIRITGPEGTATRYYDPHPQWEGDRAMIDRVAPMRRRLFRELMSRGFDMEANNRSQVFHRAFVSLLVASGIEVVEEKLPPLDPPFDPMRVS